MDYRQTIYRADGVAFNAIEVPWEAVRRVLGGRDHNGSPEDDSAVCAALLGAGAPAWVSTAPGWVDVNGWGLIGPERTVDADGYHDCPGRDCFEIAIGRHNGAPALCHECETADCDPTGESECSAPGAYGGDE